jgi:hypothetical protein
MASSGLSRGTVSHTKAQWKKACIHKAGARKPRTGIFDSTQFAAGFGFSSIEAVPIESKNSASWLSLKVVYFTLIIHATVLLRSTLICE